ncbi:probable G-protein coupled receptor Mth-like 14 [Topomyia yanbarensis]|uniref:probable G-protein coupled receptor Mth-like 14 n=1 Tax=Topomyia yanbarensis TaxID=2498891 RepID=UPI00273AA0A8|nr:probable G-protein coupled receptor Mth-like 14 [Topomyia yanbarensis]
MTPLIIVLLLIRGDSALPELKEGSGDYEAIDSAHLPSSRPIPSDDEVLDPILSEDGLYPEDDDDYGIYSEETNLTARVPTDHVVGDRKNTSGSSQGSVVEDGSDQLDLLESFDVSLGPSEPTNGTLDPLLLDIGIRKVAPEELPKDCSNYQKLSAQPRFTNATFNVIRKCCPRGESFQMGDKSHHAAQCKPGEPWGPFQVHAISAQFYDGCIEDLEEPSLGLGLIYGNPCAVEGGLVRFGEDTRDDLFVIQNGSLLVINELVEEFDIYHGYCLDVDRKSGSLNAYVCPSEIRIGGDIFKGQMVALALCLIFAIPLLLATAYFYVEIPEFDDIHGKALSLNCINFAIALLLESIFQHKSKGHGSTDDTIVLANYAEYFILATFFWLLVNCMNNCIHAWYFLPKGIQIHMGGEKRTFALYAAFAQLVPLTIILLNPPNGDPAGLKHYFFIPIIVIIVLNMLSFIITFWGFERVSDILIQHYILRGRLSTGGEAADAVLAQLPDIRAADVERVKYMTKYTAMLFVVMAGVWSITIGTYYSTRTIPILYDILFGLQGILIFIIFICLPRPFRTVKAWFQQKQICGCREDPDAVNLRRRTTYRSKNGTREVVPLNNVTSS